MLIWKKEGEFWCMEQDFKLAGAKVIPCADLVLVSHIRPPQTVCTCTPHVLRTRGEFNFMG